MVIKKNGIVIVSVLVLTVFTFIVCFGAISKTSIGEASSSGIKVVLDAGHGGIDGGVSGVNTGGKESDLNLSVVKKLEKCFIDAGISVVLTRSSEAGLYGLATKNLKKKDMQKRSEIINKAEPDLVISVHMNKYSTSSRRGAQVFYKESSENSKILADCIQQSFNSMEQSVRECSSLTGDYYILNCSPYTSVIAECGFLSNPNDEALLITEEYQQEIAYAIFKGAIEYFSETTMNFFN